MKKRKRHTAAAVALSVVLTMVFAAAGAVKIYSRFGGFKAGECADTAEFSKYAVPVEELSIPNEAKIIALGEATHGNKEFQKLRLDVLRVLVEKHGVRAFALEGDFGGCEAVNRYIHGGDGTAAEAISAIGFSIYCTEETEELVEWMRSYNSGAAQGEELCFYGFDMEQYAYSYRYLLEEIKNDGGDTSELEKIWDGKKNAYSEDYTSKQRAKIIRKVKAALASDDEQAVHYADLLLQNIELGKYLDDAGELNAHRDRMMAENVQWILKREEERKTERILISGHNNHVMKCENAGSPVLGSLLSKKMGDGYFVVGTDFYRSVCNLPKPYTGKRITHTFYSRDPLAKASKKCGFDVCFLGFSQIPEDSALEKHLSENIQMGSLGESYSFLMNFIPKSYRVSRTPKKAYDALIFVSNATPIEIEPSRK